MSAVLITFVKTEKGQCLLMEVRSMIVSQPGEICFPGGRIEKGETPVITALREINEELGISADDVEIIGELDMERMSNGRAIYPVVGRIDAAVLERIEPATDEVAEVFLLPIKWLRENAPVELDFDTAGDSEIPDQLLEYLKNYGPGIRRHGSTEYWVYDSHLIWGLTARILRRLLADPRF